MTIRKIAHGPVWYQLRCWQAVRLISVIPQTSNLAGLGNQIAKIITTNRLRTLKRLIGFSLFLSLCGCAGIYSQPYSSPNYHYGSSQTYGYPGQGYGYQQYPNYSTYSYPAYYSHHRHGDDDDDRRENRHYEGHHDRD